MKTLLPLLIAGLPTAAWYLFSSFVDSMEPLPDNAGWLQRTLYKTAQRLAANHSKAK